MSRLKLTNVTGVMSDETSGYQGEFEGTLGDLVQEVLGRGEWGYVSIKGSSESIEYGRRQGLKTAPFAESSLQRPVTDVKASGGWGRMDYYVTLG